MSNARGIHIGNSGMKGDEEDALTYWQSIERREMLKLK